MPKPSESHTSQRWRIDLRAKTMPRIRDRRNTPNKGADAEGFMASRCGYRPRQGEPRQTSWSGGGDNDGLADLQFAPVHSGVGIHYLFLGDLETLGI